MTMSQSEAIKVLVEHAQASIDQAPSMLECTTSQSLADSIEQNVDALKQAVAVLSGSDSAKGNE